jgi:hypothetical protein
MKKYNYVYSPPTEMSYVDLLNKLHEDVNSDVIPSKEKAEIFLLIAQLKEKLWKYSY